MAMEIDEAVIRVDNHAEIDEVEPIEISDDEARRVRLYENFYQVNAIDPALYAQHDVKRGLRNADGTGVMAGITQIGNVQGYYIQDGERVPMEGRLIYRGISIEDLIHGFINTVNAATDVDRDWQSYVQQQKQQIHRFTRYTAMRCVRYFLISERALYFSENLKICI